MIFMWKKIIAVAVILALCVSILWVVNPFGPDIKASADVYRGGFSITAQKSSPAGIDPATAFTLTSQKPITLDYVKKNLSIRGEPAPNVSSTDKGAFTITPSQALKKNSLYFIDLKAEDGSVVSFAFQTIKDFTVIGSLPADMSSQVPVDTGIELYFSYKDIETLQKYFEISPKADGRFEMHGNTAVFIPKKLTPGTVYRVTVKKGLPAANGSQTLQQDYSFSFETSPDPASTANPDKGSLMISGTWLDFSTFEKPVIPFDIYVPDNKDQKNVVVTAEVYRFKDIAAFEQAIRDQEKVPTWAWYNRQKNMLDVSKMEKVQSFKQTFNLEGWKAKYMMMPEVLKDGYYVVVLSYEDLRAQAFIQSTDISSYFMEDKDTTLFWVNDLKTGSPIANATVENLSMNKKGQTDARGLAELSREAVTAKEPVLDLFRITTSDGRKALVNAGYDYSGSNGYNSNQSGLQWRYLQTDRTLYKPNDVVEFWGFVKSRLDGSTPKDLTVELSQGGYYYPMDFKIMSFFMPFLSKPLLIMDLKASEGFFGGSMQLPSLDPGGYTLNVKSGDKVVSSTYINVENYIKPQYKIDITADKKAIFTDEKITFTIQASFFEGTPVSNVPIRYTINEWDGAHQGEGVTDSKGQFKVEYTPQYKSTMQGESYFGINVAASLPETGEVSQYLSFRVFANDLTLEPTGTIKDNKATITVKANTVVIGTLNDDNQENDTTVGQPVSGHPVNLSIYKYSWEKIETGEEYDFVNKVVRKTYEYKEKRELLTQQALTTGANGIATYEFAADPKFEGYYQVQITAKDKAGKSLKYETGLYNNELFKYPENDYNYIKTDKESYRSGEPVKVEFVNSKGAKLDYRTLFVESRNGIIGFDVNPVPVYTKAFDATRSPNYYVDGVMFTGKGYIQANSAIPYNSEEKKLTLKVETDKESYRPGETATIKITSVDQNGKPVKARVNISLVDEALLKLSGQNINPLAELYSFIDSGITRRSNEQGYYPMVTYSGVRGLSNGNVKMEFSENQKMMDQAAPAPMASAASFELGGGAVRSDFKDTAGFETIELNDKGEGTLTLKLPDNVTSYSLAAAAIASDLHAGSEITTAKVTMPFFINDAISTDYLTGDKPYVGLTAYGQDLTEGETVDFEVTSKELPDYIQKASAKAFERVNLPLPKLAEGTYTFTFKARSKSGKTDAIQRTVQVVSSYQSIETSVLKKLTQGMTIDAGKSGLTTLIITDESRGKIISELTGLAYGYGNRLDQKLVANYAQKLIKEFVNSDEFWFEPVDLDTASYKNQDGGYGILPYSESDMKVSALLTPLLKDVTDVSSLKLYFYNAILSADKVNAAALFGLAALGEPVLVDLNSAKDTENLTFEEYMLLGMAYAQLGETSTATEIYNERIKSQLERKDPYIRVKISGNDIDKSLEETALLAAYASLIDSPDADKLYAYVNNNYSKNVYSGVEKLLYLKDRLKKASTQAVSFVYSYDGKDYSVKLENGRSELITIPSVKARDFKVKAVTGNASVLSIFKAPLAGTASNDPDITVKRKYFNAITGKETATFAPNDIVKVEISYTINNKAIDNVYEISDYAPSGLKPLDNPSAYGVKADGWYYRNVDKQKVTFMVGKPEPKQTIKPLVYYARVSSPGEYTAEGTVAQGSLVKTSLLIGDKTTIIIKP